MQWIGRHAPRPLGRIHQPVHLPAVPVLARAVVIGRMPGWQIALIAAAAVTVASPCSWTTPGRRARRTPPPHDRPATATRDRVSFRSQSTITPPARDLNRINEPAIPA